MLKDVSLSYVCPLCRKDHSYSVEDVKVQYIPSICTYHGHIVCAHCGHIFGIPTSGYESFEKKCMEIRLQKLYDIIEEGRM